MSVTDASFTEIRYFDGDTLAELHDLRREFPNTVDSFRLAADGSSSIWVDDGELWYHRDGEAQLRLGSGYLAAWFAP